MNTFVPDYNSPLIPMLKIKIVFALVIFAVSASAQRNSQDYRFTTEFTQYIFGNIPLSVEKIVGKKVTVGLDLGVRFATKQSGTIDNKDYFPFTNKGVYDYTNQNTFNRFYNAYTLGFHFKYYFKEQRTFYLEPAFYYRYWFFNEKEIEFTRGDISGGFEGYFFEGIRNERQEDYVFCVNFGRTIKLKQTRKNKYVVDFEMGIGMIDRSYKFFTDRGSVEDVPVRSYTESGFGKHPYVNLGLSIGLER